jgi:flagellar biosynthesis/type III secretory pathway protein FliH
MKGVPVALEIRKCRSAPAPVPAASFSALVTERRRAAEQEATGLLNEAAAVAARIRGEAERDAEALRSSAHDQASVEGERRWVEAALALAERRSLALEDLEPSCVRLALEIARQIVGTALRTDADVFAGVAERACAPLRRDAELILYVSEADSDRLGPLRARVSGWKALRFELCADLEPGDCVAECNGVRVDARLDVQLAVIERRLLGASPTGGVQ